MSHGAPPPRSVRLTPPHDPTPSLSDVEDRAQVADEVSGALERIRKNAENWRTGVAGLASLVTATLLFKGQDKVDAYEPWVRYALGGLALMALALAVASLWLFLLAANGRVQRVKVQKILDGGGVLARHSQLANEALQDLRKAQSLAILSVVALAVMILLSWYGPGARREPPAYAKITFRPVAASPGEVACGEMVAQNGVTTILKIKGEPNPRRFATALVQSFALVDKC